MRRQCTALSRNRARGAAGRARDWKPYRYASDAFAAFKGCDFGGNDARAGCDSRNHRFHGYTISSALWRQVVRNETGAAAAWFNGSDVDGDRARLEARRPWGQPPSI